MKPTPESLRADIIAAGLNIEATKLVVDHFAADGVGVTYDTIKKSDILRCIGASPETMGEFAMLHGAGNALIKMTDYIMAQAPEIDVGQEAGAIVEALNGATGGQSAIAAQINLMTRPMTRAEDAYGVGVVINRDDVRKAREAG